MQNTRINYLDWLRILAIFGVLLFHSAMPFYRDYHWHIVNPVSSDILSEFNFWLSRFRMPLLFFVSGAVTSFMVKKRSTGGFVLLRLRRLFIPVIAGILIVVPPQVYVERLTQGYEGSYWDFYPSIFKLEFYPKGNFSWHHLWFIVYLFIYDLLFAPFFKWCTTDKAKAFLQKLAFFGKGKHVYLLMLPTTLLFCGMTLRYPEPTNDLIHDPLYFLYWLTFVLVGFISMVQPSIMDSLERNRRFSLGMAFLLALFINSLRWSDFKWGEYVSNYEQDWRTYVYLARYPLVAWSLVFAILGYGKRYLNFRHKAMAYINESIYPFYILHQTVILVIAYFVVRSADGVGLKYVYIVTSSFSVSMLIYHLFIRPYPLPRFLFGMKPLKKTPKTNIIPDIAIQTEGSVLARD
ncbi:acyltransferase family protein [Olivibacter sitiensis]|uniref:acyltransferase family protein n=1 Tax=Olivibacter sitiensis TaxID=376470 RepID=UPI0003F6CB6C|nr:acyltransferase family protein [Olivibacter sitiensis]